MLPKQTEYKVGMYMRLSKDDERSGESLSIENQRKILTEYVTQQGWMLYDEYVDDGISGTTFERDGFRSMVSDVQNGLVGTVIVKDIISFKLLTPLKLCYYALFTTSEDNALCIAIKIKTSAIHCLDKHSLAFFVIFPFRLSSHIRLGI